MRARYRLPGGSPGLLVSFVGIETDRTNAAVLRALRILLPGLKGTGLLLAKLLFFEDLRRVIAAIRSWDG